MLSRVVGQSHAKKILLNAFREKRLAHAYLLYGEEGLGAEELALEFARFVVCSEKKTESSEACGECSSCRKVMAFQHPDVHYYFPVLKSTTTDEWRAAVEEKSRDLYARTRVGGGSIHIGDREKPERNSIRGLIGVAGLKSFEGQYKIFIVTFAEDMNPEAANALLKILEEPPESCLFLITTAQLNLILPTIQSRCQIIKLRPAHSNDIAAALETVSAGEAKRISKLADGNFARALQLADGRQRELTDMMLGFLTAALSSHPEEIISAAENVVSGCDRDKAKVEEFLSELATWFRDSMAFSTPNRAAQGIMNEELLERLTRFIDNFPSVDIDKSQVEIEKAIDLISRNIYLNLILVNLALKIRLYCGKK